MQESRLKHYDGMIIGNMDMSHSRSCSRGREKPSTASAVTNILEPRLLSDHRISLRIRF